MRSVSFRRADILLALLLVTACGSSGSGGAGNDGGSKSADSGSTKDGRSRADAGSDAKSHDAAHHDASKLDAKKGHDSGGRLDGAGSDSSVDSGSDVTVSDARVDGQGTGPDSAKDGTSTAAGLHVVGNALSDNGKTVRLLGVDRAGSEYSCIQGNGFFDGPVDQTAVTAMLAWHINTVRVPLNEDCWLAINGSPAQYSGSLYQSAISQYVSLLRQNGLYVILDLHWNAGGTNSSMGQQEMADSDHAPDFWTGVATTFKGDHGVIFDLYNEPHDVTWACWLSGGCQTNGWTVAGMQQLVTAVRATGATNVIMAGGLGYASDLSEWLANEPVDPAGNLAASFHTYNFSGCTDSTCWTTTLEPVAAVVPLITGELGENDCAHGYIDGYMTWADGVGVSYLGWAWNADNCDSFPSLISDYTGTPTGFGAGFQTHLAAVNP